jgi:hypothetical protein
LDKLDRYLKQCLEVVAKANEALPGISPVNQTRMAAGDIDLF